MSELYFGLNIALVLFSLAYWRCKSGGRKNYLLGLAELPTNCKLYYDELSQQECQRCLANGHKHLLQTRRRFHLANQPNKMPHLEKLLAFSWCQRCDYRALIRPKR